MPLRLVATSIGDPGDLTQRAADTLRSAEIVIGEERREASKLLKSLGLEGKRIELLNEHTPDSEVLELAKLCREHDVALITDCGTPGFCDPGARLVAACRSQSIPASPVPGASSLMCLLSVSGRPMNQFLFRGFIPADKEERSRALNELDRERKPFVLMDTPYRMGRLLEELAKKWPDRIGLLGCDFTQPNETVVEAKLKDLPSLVGDRKAEFIIAVFPSASETPVRPEAAAKKPVQTRSFHHRKRK